MSESEINEITKYLIGWICILLIAGFFGIILNCLSRRYCYKQCENKSDYSTGRFEDMNPVKNKPFSKRRGKKRTFSMMNN